jgi:hypothetical protein
VSPTSSSGCGGGWLSLSRRGGGTKDGGLAWRRTGIVNEGRKLRRAAGDMRCHASRSLGVRGLAGGSAEGVCGGVGRLFVIFAWDCRITGFAAFAPPRSPGDDGVCWSWLAFGVVLITGSTCLRELWFLAETGMSCFVSMVMLIKGWIRGLSERRRSDAV